MTIVLLHKEDKNKHNITLFNKRSTQMTNKKVKNTIRSGMTQTFFKLTCISQFTLVYFSTCFRRKIGDKWHKFWQEVWNDSNL